MPRSLIALGANLGPRAETLRRAIERLRADESSSAVIASSFHETSPVGGPEGQQPFLNAALALDTALSPEALHARLKRLETELGRQPAERWAARTIDLDLLLYADQVVGTPTLAVPHPRMAFRRFVLAPAAEVAPHMVHPLNGWSVAQLLTHLATAPSYVALLALPGTASRALAANVAKSVGATRLSLASDAAPATADPSGPADERQIQFLRRAAQVLASHDWNARGEVAVSDFYFDQCLAYARVGLDEPRYARFCQAWQAARQQVVAPKLLVVLEEWELGYAVAGGQPPRSTPPDRLRDELLALATRGNVGPVLYAGRDPQAQHDEITAAIAAMR